jgi:broad specificity phosphatase PhoE
MITAIRHAPVDAAWADRFIGTLDIPLSVEGRAAARGAREAAIQWAGHAIYCSPLRRARDTAEELFPTQTVIVVDALQERCLGAWEGRLKQEVRLACPHAFLANGRMDPTVVPEGGEPMIDVFRRVGAFIRNLTNNGGPTILVTHNGVITALKFLLSGESVGDATAEPAVHLAPIVFSTWRIVEATENTVR